MITRAMESQIKQNKSINNNHKYMKNILIDRCVSPFRKIVWHFCMILFTPIKYPLENLQPSSGTVGLK